MVLARFKDLVVDAVDPAALGVFLAGAVGLDRVALDDGDGKLTGPTPQHTIWINRVPEPKTVKHRVHLDLYARSIADLEALGARKVEEFPEWTVMQDVEGGEFCAFLRDDLPRDRIHGLVVDCADRRAQAAWWASVYDADVAHHQGWSTVENIPGMPVGAFDFVQVPEPKTVKNRVHWDVHADVADLAAAGARVLRERDAEISWTVMADPEGNEFCVFDPET
ncbi:VOC family protein [Actinocorallia populi]|uniref:VOC family protein n=1 Tax=Actinocorallia populi TaxID=2079200 RepID=UPI000D08CCB3|nr:VOC family protein [Actinocorallia populi]